MCKSLKIKMLTQIRIWSTNIISICLLLTTCKLGANTTEVDFTPTASPYPMNVYWGDTHVHTALSSDAYIFGVRLMPDDAYRFAKGEMVTSTSGEKVRLHRPLDFLMVSDHAENIGVIARIDAGDKKLLQTEAGRRTAKAIDYPISLKEALNANTDAPLNELIAASMLAIKADQGSKKGLGQADYGQSKRFIQSVWAEVIDSAERHYDPGKFTTFTGYEWTVTNATGHRNVIFADGPELTKQILPFSAFDSMDPEDLWSFLRNYENLLGGQAFAIPHNGNFSGRMFAPTNTEGGAISQSYAQTRAIYEPLYEVTQIKGDGETHPLLSPNDEFADYETFRWRVTKSQPDSKKSSSKTIDSKTSNTNSIRPKGNQEFRYARSALKIGLSQAAELGSNPFKFGMIGSTDSHTALATADQNNFWGKLPGNEPSRNRIMTGWNYSAGGYAAVWARENTREAIFASMRRKEVYASTGPRIKLRFFGGWNFIKDDSIHPNLAQIGYEKGVPMGSDLTLAPKNTSPSFLIQAVKDPEGANLDRVQIIKGWRSKDGKLNEQIFNVALSDNRREKSGGSAKVVGNTVDIKQASFNNSIGDPELTVVWTDPDFNSDLFAFYYVRVLEIPTPRWTAYDAKRYSLNNLPQNIPMVTQERAYSSPIWYSPI